MYLFVFWLSVFQCQELSMSILGFGAVIREPLRLNSLLIFTSVHSGPFKTNIDIQLTLLGGTTEEY